MKRRSAVPKKLVADGKLPEDGKLPVCCGGWVTQTGGRSPFHVVFGRKDNSTTGGASRNSLEVAQYDPKSSVVSDPVYVCPTAGGSANAIAVHPKGDGIVCSFEDSCRLFEIVVERDEVVNSSGSEGKEIPELNGAGAQKLLAFSPDGSILAAGTENGHLRVFNWPSMTVILDEPHTLKQIRDLDISMDSARVAVSGGGVCQVWSLHSATKEGTLLNEGDMLDCCRFSKAGKKPFLFVVVNRGGKGYIGVWVINEWEKCLGLKKVQHTSVTSLAVTPNGKRLAIGGLLGQITILEVVNMSLVHKVQTDQAGSITFLEFSRNGRELLSLAEDSTSEVLPIHLEREWKEWEIYSILAASMLLSVVIAYWLYLISDNFWNAPPGRR